MAFHRFSSTSETGVREQGSNPERLMNALGSFSSDSTRLCVFGYTPEADIGTAVIYEYTPWYRY
jgi:hypothetical protein